MYLQTLIILTTVVLRLNDIRTRFLLLGFVIMLDKSIRRNKTCCRRKVLAVLFSHVSTRRARKCESIFTRVSPSSCCNLEGYFSNIHVDTSVALFSASHSCTSGNDSFNHFSAKLACTSTIAIVYPTVFMLSRLSSLKV